MRKFMPFLAIVVLFTLLSPLPADAQNRHDESRDTWQHPEYIMNVIGVHPGMVIGEAGAGGGYFTVKLAKAVGVEGKIYANDISEKIIGSLRERLEEEKITNVVMILGEEDDPLFPDGSLDMAFMINVYHHLDDPEMFFTNLRSDLKDGATVAIVDYAKEAGQDRKHATDPDAIVAMAEKVGYQVVTLDRKYSRFFIIVLRPAESAGSPQPTS